LTLRHVTWRAKYKWSPRQRKEAIIGTRIMLGIQIDGRAPVRASEVEALRDIDMCVWTVIEVLATAGALIEDRVPAIDAWFVERITGLPDPMVAELRIWFDIMKNGTRTPPRHRPRSQQSITLHLHWALPTLRQWATAGHASLREITKEHVLDALPAAGAERSRAGQGLRSIFRLLKARKVLFLDPTARVKTGVHPTNQPLPLDPERIGQVRDLLFADDPATALVVALIAFHGIRMGQLQRIRAHRHRRWPPDRRRPQHAARRPRPRTPRRMARPPRLLTLSRRSAHGNSATGRHRSRRSAGRRLVGNERLAIERRRPAHLRTGTGEVVRVSKVDDIIAAESDALEQAELPDPLPARARVGRRNDTRSRMFSVRLRDDELAELGQVAQQRGLPARTLARTWLLDRLHTEQHSGSEDLAARVERLEHAVFPG